MPDARPSRRRKLDADVIIAGAGPAGAAAATHLATTGVRVLLLDRHAFPRDKVCGDFVSPVALRELRALGLTHRSEFRPTNIIHEAAVYLDGQHLLTAAIPRVARLQSTARVIPRKILDAWIAARAGSAGADLRERHRVTGYQVGRDDVEVTAEVGERATRVRTLRARALIGADGSSSVVARLLRGDHEIDDDRIIAVRGYYTGIKGPSDRADLCFSSDTFPGYCWLFPTTTHDANVGVGAILKTLPPTSEHLRALLLRRIAADPALNGRLGDARLIGKIVGWPLTTYNPGLPVLGDRVLLVGDAAGLINPLNGEGIQYALLSGRWAAQTLLECVTRGDFSRAALEPYASRLDTELGRDLGLARLLVQLIRNRALNAIWLEALQAIVARAAVDPEYAEITGGVLAGVIPTRQVLRLAVVRKTLEQATLRVGRRALRQFPHHPADLTRLGLWGTQAGIDIGSTMLRHPVESKRWARNLVASLAELLRPARSRQAIRR